MQCGSRQTGHLLAEYIKVCEKASTSVAPPVPAGGRTCDSSSECPALLPLNDESTWNCSLAWLYVSSCLVMAPGIDLPYYQ